MAIFTAPARHTGIWDLDVTEVAPLNAVFNKEQRAKSKGQCGAKRRIRAPRARSARGASQLCVSKKSFCFFWIRACTTKRECSPRGRCGFGGVCFSTYPDFHVALFSHIKGTQNKRKHKHTHTRHTHRDCDYAGQ